MKPLWWMIGASLTSALAIGAMPGVERDREVVLGMLAPLLAAAGTWVMVVRVYPSEPARLTPLMMAAFGAKLVFFGVYVTLMLTVAALDPLPFVISFTVYFIALHLFEAVCLQRLFAGAVSFDGRRAGLQRPPGAA